VMSFVLLPILPNQPVDPWGALIPRQLWLMIVIIAGLSFVGYICVRVAGDRAGLIYAAAAGGLVSSTTVTWTYARLSRAQPDSSMALAAGVTTSWAVSLLRMSGIGIALAPGLFGPLAAILAVPVMILVGAALLFYRRSADVSERSPLVLANPFELGEVLKFGLLLAAVTLIAKLTTTSTNHLGLIPLAAVSGFVDVDPVTLSTARIAGQTIPLVFAASVIIIAGGANQLCKTALAIALGSRAFALYIAGISVVTAASAAALWSVFG